jgi:hypothetical protein
MLIRIPFGLLDRRAGAFEFLHGLVDRFPDLGGHRLGDVDVGSAGPDHRAGAGVNRSTGDALTFCDPPKPLSGILGGHRPAARIPATTNPAAQHSSASAARRRCGAAAATTIVTACAASTPAPDDHHHRAGIAGGDHGLRKMPHTEQPHHRQVAP